MRRALWTMVGMAVVAGAMAAERPELKTEKDKVSYSVGMNVGRALKQQQIDVDLGVMSTAIRDVLEGKETLLEEQQARQILMDYQRESARKAGEKNLAEADKFLAEHRKKQGVVVTASGLQYEIVTPGTGPRPTTNDTVQVHYRGTLADGTEFDNSYKKGPATKFKVTGVIPGWTEALLLMPVGSKWKLAIPPTLGYGARARPNIPANSALLFDVELVGIEPKTETPAAPATGATVQPKPESK